MSRFDRSKDEDAAIDNDFNDRLNKFDHPLDLHGSDLDSDEDVVVLGNDKAGNQGAARSIQVTFKSKETDKNQRKPLLELPKNHANGSIPKGNEVAGPSRQLETARSQSSKRYDDSKNRMDDASRRPGWNRFREGNIHEGVKKNTRNYKGYVFINYQNKSCDI